MGLTSYTFNGSFSFRETYRTSSPIIKLIVTKKVQDHPGHCQLYSPKIKDKTRLMINYYHLSAKEKCPI